MAAARGWTRGKWNAPAVPPGATAVRFGVALRSDGTVATSRYSLMPVHFTSTRLIAFGALVAPSWCGRRRPRAPPPAGRELTWAACK